MSHFGAVKAHEDIRDYHVYDSSGQAYYDPGNDVYSWVLANVWPGSLPDLTNIEKRGDVVEALLGFCWFMSHPEGHPQDFHWPLYLYQSFDKVIRYIDDHWYERRNLL